MQDTSSIEENASMLALHGSEPDESWPDKMLLDCGREAIKESDVLEAQAQPLIRRSVGSRLRGGHAMSILRARLKAEGRWSSFQQQQDLPRTTMWQMIEVYERSAKDGHAAQDLVENYGSWTGILLAYGLAQPRKSPAGGCVVEQLEPPAADEDDDVQGDAVEDDGAEEEPKDEELDEDTDSDESQDESPNAEPEEAAEEELPPVTDDQVVAADTSVAAVGGLEHAARALIARSIKSGDKEGVEDALSEMVRAARTLLTPAEITEIVIVGNARGVKWVSV